MLKIPEIIYGTASLAGGAAAEAETVRGVTALDTVMAIPRTVANAVYLRSVAPTANTLTFTFSADPGVATVDYYIIKPRV